MIQYSSRHVDVGLTGFAKRLDNQEFIWPLLMPRYSVKKDSDLYWIYGDEHFKVPYAKRADKSESDEVEWSVSNTSYRCEASGLHVKISDRDRRNADSGMKIEQEGTMLAREKTMLAIEKEVADLLTSTSNITNYSTLAASAAAGSNLARWDNYDSGESHPLKIIATAIKSIYDNTLKVANTLVLPWPVWNALEDHPDMEALLKYQAGKQLIEGRAIPKIIKECKVILAKAAYDSTKKNVTRTTFTNLWSDTVLVAYINPRIGWGVDTLGVTFDCQGPVVRKWRDDDKNCDKIEFEEQGLDHKLIDANCGYLLVDTLT